MYSSAVKCITEIRLFAMNFSYVRSVTQRLQAHVQSCAINTTLSFRNVPVMQGDSPCLPGRPPRTRHCSRSVFHDVSTGTEYGALNHGPGDARWACASRPDVSLHRDAGPGITGAPIPSYPSPVHQHRPTAPKSPATALQHGARGSF